jgi:hypothetical protein
MAMQMVGQVHDELGLKLRVWLALFSLTAASFGFMYAGVLLIFGAIRTLVEAVTGYGFRAEALASATSWLGVGCFATGVFVFACLVRGSLETRRIRR